MILHSPDEPARTTVPYDEDVVVVLSDLYNTLYVLSLLSHSLQHASELVFLSDIKRFSCSISSQDLLWRYRRYGTGINGQPGDEPVGDGGTINGISQAKCAYTPSTDSTLPERRRRVHSGEKPQLRGMSGTGRMLRRSPAHQLDQPVIPENNTCVDELRETVKERYATFDLRRGKTYRLRIINAGQCLHFSLWLIRKRRIVCFHSLTSIRCSRHNNCLLPCEKLIG